MAERGKFEPIWSERLIEEWHRAAMRNGGSTDAAFAEMEAASANQRFAGAMVEPGDDSALWLPDPADIHVLATAISGQADVIITLNLRDFPRRELSVHAVEARSPDDVLMEFWVDSGSAVEAAVEEAHRAAEAHANSSLPLRPLLKRARLPRLGKALANR